MEIVKKIDVSNEEMASYVMNALDDEYKDDPIFEDEFDEELLTSYEENCSTEVDKILKFIEEDFRKRNFKNNEEIYFARGGFRLTKLTELENYLVYLKLKLKLEENKEALGYVSSNLEYNYDSEKAEYKVYVHK